MASEVLEWRALDGNDKYEVSNCGDVRNATTRNILVTHKEPNYYVTIRIANKCYLVHRLVAVAFIPNPEDKKTVNHKNHDRHDNRLENLEWATMTEQNAHKRPMKERVPAPSHDILGEEWKEWPTEPSYQVSNLGRIKNDNRFIKIYDTDVKYNNVSIKKGKKFKTLSLHRIVAETWCDNWDEEMSVNHIDGDKHNNKADNLECITQSDNIRKSYGTNQKMAAKLVRVRRSPMGDDGVVVEYPSLSDAASNSGLQESSIAYACNHNGHHGGYIWAFIDKLPTSVPEGNQACSTCCKVFPITDFVGKRGRPVKMCGACLAKTNAASKRDREQLDNDAEVPDGHKRCSGQCRKIHPMTEFHAARGNKETRMCSSCRAYMLARTKA